MTNTLECQIIYRALIETICTSKENAFKNKISFVIAICTSDWKSVKCAIATLHGRSVDSGRIVEISFQILRLQVSGRCHLTLWRLMTVDVGNATACTVDGWTEFTADHLSARRSTTDLTRRRHSAVVVVFTISHRHGHCIHVSASCTIPFVFIASQHCVSLASF